MSATLRIHRGWASASRQVMLGKRLLGGLDAEINEFEIEPGRHVVELAIGRYHSLPTAFSAHDGQVLDFTVVENPDAILPMLLGGSIRLEKVPHHTVMHL